MVEELCSLLSGPPEWRRVVRFCVRFGFHGPCCIGIEDAGKRWIGLRDGTQAEACATKTRLQGCC